MPDTQRSQAASAGGRYAIHAEIGAGGMASVHLGRLVGARGFSRTVAIKVLHATYAKNKDFVERFLDEARIVGRIHHPNVMPTLDVIAEGDDLRIVMDYVAGESLDQLELKAQARGERVPQRLACAIMAGVLHGLHAAHEAKNEFGEPLGIVHLDVSPQNILVGTDGTSRVLDFGVARARVTADRAASLATGKSAYLAPEQVRRGELTPRTDVFAASIVLWELLTGEPLFASDNHAATMQRVLGGVIPRVSEKAEAIPPRLDEILSTGLSRDPNRRFATARDMALAIEEAVAPALPSEVGRWVETVAEATLVARAAQVREMEAQSARPQPASDVVLALPAEPASDDGVPDESGASFLRPPTEGADAVPQRAADGSIRWRARAAPDAEIGLAPGPRGRRGTLPSVAVPAPAPPPRKRRGLRTTVLVAAGAVLLALALVVVGGRVFFLPGYIKATVITEAAARGVTLTIEDAALSEDGVELRGLLAKLAGVPFATVAVATADVHSVWSSVFRASLGTTEVTVDGDARAVADALSAWSAAHRGRPKTDDEAAGGQIDVPSLHLVWAHPSRDVARLEALGVKGVLGSPSSVSIGDDAHFVVKTVTLDTRVGLFGPWHADVDATLKETRARVAFDPAVLDGPNALLVVDASGDASLDLTVPRAPVGSLGVPRTAFGPDLPFPQQVEVTAHLGQLHRDQTSASSKVALYGLHVPELGGNVDAHFSGGASGPSGGPLPLRNGLFTVGAIRASISGTVTPIARNASLRGNLAWKAEPVACASLAALPTPGAAARDLTQKAADADLGDLGQLARDLGALGEALGAVKVTGSFAASGTVVFDTADLTQSKVTTAAKNACGIALFQGPRAPSGR